MLKPVQSSGPSYESLMNYKRSTDPTSIARRASLNEQKPPSGFFGSMWYKYVLLAYPSYPIPPPPGLRAVFYCCIQFTPFFFSFPLHSFRYSASNIYFSYMYIFPHEMPLQSTPSLILDIEQLN